MVLILTRNEIERYLAGTTMRALATERSVDIGTIRNAFLRQDVPIRSRSEAVRERNKRVKRGYVAPQSLIDAYYFGTSISKLATVHNIPEYTLTGAFHRQGVVFRTLSEAQKLLNRGYVAPQEMIDQYLVGASYDTLESLFEVDATAIRKALIRQGVSLRSVNYIPNAKHRRTSRLKTTEEWKNWRTAVYRRDNWTCQLCQQRGSRMRLNAHHIQTRDQYPERTYDVTNGITLCAVCHSSIRHAEQTYEAQFFTYTGG